MLSVHDDGQGFEQGKHSGFGIKGIEERVEQLNGTLHIQSGSRFTGTLSEVGLPISTLSVGQTSAAGVTHDE